MMSAADAGWLVEARAGSLARVEGRPAAADSWQIGMAEWKRIVSEAVVANATAPLRLVYGGGANLITGYRLYYMLQFAKRAGVRVLALYTDGRFWIDEATDWLIESGVDHIVLCLPGGEPADALARHVSELNRRTAAGSGRPRVTVRVAAPGVTAASLE